MLSLHSAVLENIIFLFVICFSVCNERSESDGQWQGVLPGTVSGKVSFCMVCIAFNALRALYHLKQDKDILVRDLSLDSGVSVSEIKTLVWFAFVTNISRYGEKHIWRVSLNYAK